MNRRFISPLALITALLFALRLSAAEPTPEQLALLKTFRDEFVSITPGKGQFPADFEMGVAASQDKAAKTDTNDKAAIASGAPAHRVRFEYAFSISRYEVTQELWTAVMDKNPSRWQGPRNSVEMISFDEAVTFCARATSQLQAAKLIDAKQVVRLPSEAEWEYCARAGTTTRYSFGDDPKEINAYAWHTGNAAGNDPPGGAKKPNPWKLYDMHGYLWEWCADDWHDNYDHAPTDGSAWRAAKGEPATKRTHGVLRSGSWKDPAERLTSAYRRRASHELRDDAVGFRCVLAGKPAK